MHHSASLGSQQELVKEWSVKKYPQRSKVKSTLILSWLCSFPIAQLRVGVYSLAYRKRSRGKGPFGRCVPAVILGRFRVQVSTRFQSPTQRLNIIRFDLTSASGPFTTSSEAGRVFCLRGRADYEDAGCMDQATRERVKLLDDQIQKETDPEKVRQLMEESLRILDNLAKNNAGSDYDRTTTTTTKNKLLHCSGLASSSRSSLRSCILVLVPSRT